MAGERILIVEARYYEAINDALLEGARAVLAARECEVEHVVVPGAFEIPAAVRWAAESGRYDGYVTLGCVIRGETSHYDYVCGECARGLQDLAAQRLLPIGFGVLTVENEEQAWARAKPGGKDKGGEAARACLAMLALKERLAE